MSYTTGRMQSIRTRTGTSTSATCSKIGTGNISTDTSTTKDTNKDTNTNMVTDLFNSLPIVILNAIVDYLDSVSSIVQFCVSSSKLYYVIRNYHLKLIKKWMSRCAITICIQPIEQQYHHYDVLILGKGIE